MDETAWKAAMWAYYVWQKATPKSQLAVPWAKRQVAKIRPRIEKREPRGLLDPMME